MRPSIVFAARWVMTGLLAGAGGLCHGEGLPEPAVSSPDCDPTSESPKLRATGPAEFPDRLWDGKESWTTSLVFRLDSTGAPSLVRVSLLSFGPDAKAYELVRTSESAFSRYRFCLPAEFSPKTDWRATLRFAHVALQGVREGQEIYLQVFIPSYTRADAAAKRAGNSVVVGSFGADGRPTSVRITESSGDEALDAKSLDSMRSMQMTYRHGEAMRFPLSFAQPFEYKLP